jgi:hypothetical protein
MPLRLAMGRGKSIAVKVKVDFMRRFHMVPPLFYENKYD